MLYMYIHTRSFLCVHSRQSSFFFFFPFCFLHSPRLSSSPLSRLILLLFRLFFCDLTVLLCSRELFTLMWHWGGLLKMAGAPQVPFQHGSRSLSSSFPTQIPLLNNFESEGAKLKNHLSFPPFAVPWVSLYIVWARRLVFFVDFSRVTRERKRKKQNFQFSTKKTRKYLGGESLKKILSTMNPVETNFSG